MMRSVPSLAAAAGLVALGLAGPARAAETPQDTPQLAFGWTDMPKRAKADTVQHASFALVNKGKAAASDGVILAIRATRGLDLPQRFSNCEYSDRKWSYYNSQVLCFVPGVVEAGAAYELSTKLDVAAGHIAYKDWLYAEALPDTAANRVKLRGDVKPVKGEGPELKLNKAAEGAPEPQLESEDEFIFANKADFAVTGTPVRGKPGETVKASVEFRNHGPAWVNELWRQRSLTGVAIDFPAGVEVVKAPEHCAVPTPDYPVAPGVDYTCFTSYIVKEDERDAFTFEVRLGKKAGTAKGRAEVTSAPIDPDKENNAAELVFETVSEGSGTGGTSGGAAGGSTTGSTTSGSTGGSATGGSATTGGTSGTSGSSGSSGGSTTGGTTTSGGTTGTATGGRLAATGTSAAPVGGAAALLVTAGAAVTFAVRRRGSAAGRLG